MHTNSVLEHQIPCHSQPLEKKEVRAWEMLRKRNTLWEKKTAIYMEVKENLLGGAMIGECYAGGTLFIP
jgi:hypothetical protein